MEFALQKSIKIEKNDILENLRFLSENLVLVKLYSDNQKLSKLNI